MSVAAVIAKEGSTPSSNWYDVAISQAKVDRRNWRNPGLKALQASANESWDKVLFPTPRLEAWKYTNTEEIARGDFKVISGSSSGKEIIDEIDCSKLPLQGAGFHQMVFVDGIYSDELSEKQNNSDVRIDRIASLALESNATCDVGISGGHLREPFAALATALMKDGLVVSIPRGAILKQPIHIIHLVTERGEGAVLAPRVLIKAEEGSQISVVETHLALGSPRYLSLPICEIIAEEGAVVDYYRCQNESPAAYHVSFLWARQASHSTVHSHIASFGGRLVRNAAEVLLNGTGASATLNGVTVLEGSQHVDNSTLIHHIEPNTESREHFKGIYSGRSKGVFSGTITVESEAQKTNAFQSNQAILLSPDASIESRPQLKIWADDVKCTHGATVGQLDADALFYLRSRGLSRAAAEHFLVHAFASEVITPVRIDSVREYVEGALSVKLAGIQE